MPVDMERSIFRIREEFTMKAATVMARDLEEEECMIEMGKWLMMGSLGRIWHILLSLMGIQSVIEQN